MTGLVSSFNLVFILTLLTRLSLPILISVIRPNGHRPLGTFTSWTRTRSSGLRFLTGCCHFWLACKKVKYSLHHLSQNLSVILWTNLHFLTYISPEENTPQFTDGFPRHNKRWLGVKATSSFGSSLDFVMGREFTIFSTLQKTVDRMSSVKRSFLPSNAHIIRRTVLIILSHATPLWEARGGGIKNPFDVFCTGFFYDFGPRKFFWGFYVVQYWHRPGSFRCQKIFCSVCIF